MLKKAMDPRVPTDLASWTLDKYKQLHILKMMYEKYPDMDWYFMMDADTYLVLPNLLTWVKMLPDPRTNALYLGSPANVGNVQFAHGGSGILLSQAAMYKFAVEDKGVASRWDKPMHEECCGDLVIGKVFKEHGVELKPSWVSLVVKSTLFLSMTCVVQSEGPFIVVRRLRNASTLADNQVCDMRNPGLTSHHLVADNQWGEACYHAVWTYALVSACGDDASC
jgi:hypothetical protein